MVIKGSDDKIKELFDYYRDNTELDLENGQLKFIGTSIMWTRVSLLYNLQVDLVGLVGDAAFELMRSIAGRHGSSFYTVARRYVEGGGNVSTQDAMLNYLATETAAIGWGRIEIEAEDGKYSITAPKGFPVGREALLEKKTYEYSFDSYYLGYFEGFLSALENRPIRGTEVKCVAKGDKLCRMEFHY